MAPTQHQTLGRSWRTHYHLLRSINLIIYLGFWNIVLLKSYLSDILAVLSSNGLTRLLLVSNALRERWQLSNNNKNSQNNKEKAIPFICGKSTNISISVEQANISANAMLSQFPTSVSALQCAFYCQHLNKTWMWLTTIKASLQMYLSFHNKIRIYESGMRIYFSISTNVFTSLPHNLLVQDKCTTSSIFSSLTY